MCCLKSVSIHQSDSIVSVSEREENTSEGECETGGDTVTTDRTVAQKTMIIEIPRKKEMK